jgi:PTS system nitrogen regulatory IIA component
MSLDEILDDRHVLIGLKPADKAALLEQLARRVATSTEVEPRAIAAALSAREALGSTGVGAGVALPHARVEGLSRTVAAFARLDSAIDFEAVDDEPVDLVFLLLSPPGGDKGHLKILAAAARQLRRPELRARLRRAGTAGELRAILTAPEP